MPLILALLACSPLPEAEALARALEAARPLEEARALCEQTGASRDACLAALGRARPAEASSVCAAIVDARWRGECSFARAEHHAQQGDRWAALTACALAGRFQDECHYHAWSFELQARATEAGSAVDTWPQLQDTIAYWSGLETLTNDAREQLLGDAWFVAHSRNPPARLSDCDRLKEPLEREGCRKGTAGFVQRTVHEELSRGAVPARVLERACRGGAEARDAFAGVYAPDPELDAARDAALAEACAAALSRTQEDPQSAPRRAWSPIFGTRRGRVSSALPPLGAPEGFGAAPQHAPAPSPLPQGASGPPGPLPPGSPP